MHFRASCRSIRGGSIATDHPRPVEASMTIPPKPIDAAYSKRYRIRLSGGPPHIVVPEVPRRSGSTPPRHFGRKKTRRLRITPSFRTKRKRGAPISPRRSGRSEAEIRNPASSQSGTSRPPIDIDVRRPKTLGPGSSPGRRERGQTNRSVRQSPPAEIGWRFQVRRLGAPERPREGLAHSTPPRRSGRSEAEIRNPASSQSGASRPPIDIDVRRPKTLGPGSSPGRREREQANRRVRQSPPAEIGWRFQVRRLGAPE
jgi:hypothetical protein